MTTHNPTIQNKYPTILFDGVCNLCNSSVQFVIARDPDARFRFASLQSDWAQQQLAHHKLPPTALDTVTLLDTDGRVYTRSTAAIKIAAKLGAMWPLMQALYIIPRPLRDLVYDWIARNRYRWFGKEESCWIPTPELRNRFLG